MLNSPRKWGTSSFLVSRLRGKLFVIDAEIIQHDVTFVLMLLGDILNLFQDLLILFVEFLYVITRYEAIFLIFLNDERFPL